ncbi:hypothetical protein [Mesorhizobium sp. M0663]|uniref:ATP-dependent DNA ligase n=2 Tax=unclassified Mesorhizobium TaxID=325217 RepID=UPI0033388B25
MVAKPPEREHWIHEIKLDGYRTQIVINSPDDIRIFTKSGADWTSKYTGLVEAARELDVENAIFEGEAVVTNAPERQPASVSSWSVCLMAVGGTLPRESNSHFA